MFDASYLVMGLGDVYLGAPVATPLDPRHRLVTTKYNPARTWTPENAVGIGGAYLCVYGMEGPGGYQFVGRTVQMWNRYRQTVDFSDGKQWLLRFFDQIRFYPVTARRAAEDAGRLPAGPVRVARRALDAEAGRAAPLPRGQRRVDLGIQVAAAGARSRRSANAGGSPARPWWRAASEPDMPAADAAEVPEGCVAVGSPVTGQRLADFRGAGRNGSPRATRWSSWKR